MSHVSIASCPSSLAPWLHQLARRNHLVVAAVLLSTSARPMCAAFSAKHPTHRSRPLVLSVADARVSRSRIGVTTAFIYQATKTSEPQIDEMVPKDDFAPSYWNALDREGRKNYRISNMLVVGDGDLSYSASVAPELAELGINLTATVLEEKERHERVYRNSLENTEAILSAHDNHEVRFGINATDLPSHFVGMEAGFDRIQFNFPHWRGKANHRYNRALLSSFLQSASGYLSPRIGEIHIALCEGQGGATAKTRENWRSSWKAAEFAAEHGLLLMDVSTFKPRYDLSSHRGMDRAFKIGKVPKLYVFAKPSGVESRAERRFTMCCRHELHVNIPPESEMKDSRYDLDDIIHGNAIHSIIEGVVDPGIRVEIPMRKLLTPKETCSDSHVCVYLIVYCGEWKPMTRDRADLYRSLVEEEVARHVPLRENRAGRIVSRPFPYSLLQNLIDHYIATNQP